MLKSRPPHSPENSIVQGNNLFYRSSPRDLVPRSFPQAPDETKKERDKNETIYDEETENYKERDKNG